MPRPLRNCGKRKPIFSVIRWIDYAAGEMTVIELVTRYMNLKRSLKENSFRAYDSVINRIREDPFGQKQIRHVKLSDAKSWFVSLHDRGYKQNTIGVMQCVVRPAFEMAMTSCERTRLSSSCPMWFPVTPMYGQL